MSLNLVVLQIIFYTRRTQQMNPIPSFNIIKFLFKKNYNPNGYNISLYFVGADPLTTPIKKNKKLYSIDP